jgi:RNA polymerase sigma-70 factor (ECF subfamily)
VTQPSLRAELGIDDAALALAAGRGNAQAFRALYLRHHHGVLTFVTKLVGAGSDREDVVQDVFLQLYRALPKFRGDSSLSTFLRRITMNVAFDHVRKRSRHQRIDYDNDALDAAMDAGQDPEQHSSARQQLQSLFHHLDNIALDKRRALLLVAIAGCSLNAAAAQMGANALWVKQRIAGARRELTVKTAYRRASRRTPRVNAL